MNFEKINSLVSELFEMFYHIGANEEGKGVTRLGYEVEEDLMHEKFIELGKSHGFNTEIDSVGNSILSNVSEGEKYFLMGSHLDSVIEGGRYDGVLGVLTGLAILIISKEENLHIPMKVVAFRCEENNNFSTALIGSKFFTGLATMESLGHVKSIRGETLAETFQERGYDPKPYDMSDIINYIEIHIEQGRVLEDRNLSIGIVTDIAGVHSQSIMIKGLSEHSGATPMDIRKDALCGASEIILAIERLGNKYEKVGCRATVGIILNTPNALNVVPGFTEISMDVRGIIIEEIDNLYSEIMTEIEEITKRRNLEFTVRKHPWLDPVKLDKNIIKNLELSSNKLNIPNLLMSSGAGHDAMNLVGLVPTGMLFIPCREGISHNPAEDIDTMDLAKSIQVLLEYYNNFKIA